MKCPRGKIPTMKGDPNSVGFVVDEWRWVKVLLILYLQMGKVHDLKFIDFELSSNSQLVLVNWLAIKYGKIT